MMNILSLVESAIKNCFGHQDVGRNVFHRPFIRVICGVPNSVIDSGVRTAFPEMMCRSSLCPYWDSSFVLIPDLTRLGAKSSSANSDQVNACLKVFGAECANSRNGWSWHMAEVTGMAAGFPA